jgi:hypothetical protein
MQKTRRKKAREGFENTPVVEINPYAGKSQPLKPQANRKCTGKSMGQDQLKA